jgi:hypothetical protein
MVQVTEKVLEHRLVELEVPTSIHYGGVEQVDFRAFLERCAGRHVKSETRKPIQ